MFPSPAVLKKGGKYFARSKPQYEDTPASLIISPHDFGAAGDGTADDTAALNQFFLFLSQQFNQGYVGFVDAGYYKVTDTVYIPPNCRIVGEALASIIMGSGPKFSDMNNTRPIILVGKPGEQGYLEWSDMLVSTQGATSGAVLIEYNLQGCNCDQGPSGMWDVHIRIGGFAGSQLQVGQCPKTPGRDGVIYGSCITAYLGMHVTKYASDLYLENNWFWVAE